jgi:hypothetical protein
LQPPEHDVHNPVQLPLQYCGDFSEAEEMKGIFEATKAPSIGNTIPAAFLKKPRRDITLLSFFIILIFEIESLI